MSVISHSLLNRFECKKKKVVGELSTDFFDARHTISLFLRENPPVDDWSLARVRERTACGCLAVFGRNTNHHKWPQTRACVCCFPPRCRSPLKIAAVSCRLSTWKLSRSRCEDEMASLNVLPLWHIHLSLWMITGCPPLPPPPPPLLFCHHCSTGQSFYHLSNSMKLLSLSAVYSMTL